MSTRILIVDDTPSIHDDFTQILNGPAKENADTDRLNELAESLFDEPQETVTSASDTKFKMKHDVDHAYNGEEAIEKIRAAIQEQRPYTLVFMDVRMPPGMDGIQTIQKVHRTWPGIDMDFAICTAFSDYSWEDMVNLLDYPDRVYFIRKPFDRVAILQLVLALFESRALRNERNQALQALSAEFKISAKSLEKYKLIFHQTRDGLFHYDLDTGEKRFNPKMVEMWGFDPDAQGETEQFIEKFNLFFDFYYGSTDAPKAQTVGFPIVQKHNIIRWVSFTLQVIQDKCSPLRMVDIRAVDITDQKLRERAKLEVEVAKAKAKAKTELLNHMSHELRTPINGVLGMCELIKGTDLDEKQSDYIHCIDRSTTHLLCLINDILDHAKFESGNMVLEQISFDFYQLVEDVSSIFLKKILDTGVPLYVDIAETVPRYLVGDPMRLGQILINYLSNAFKFTPRGKITLKVTPNPTSENVLHFNVQDTGIGIAPEKLDTIFDRFVQADASTARQYGGTGLGLAICKDLAQLMRGNVSVTSTEGQGSDFGCTITVEQCKHTPNAQPYQGDIIIISSAPDAPLISRYLTQFGMRCSHIESVDLADFDHQQYDASKADYLLVDLSHQADHAIKIANRLVTQTSFKKCMIIGSAATATEKFSPVLQVNQSIERPITPLKIERLLSTGLHHPTTDHTENMDEAAQYAGKHALVVDDNSVNVKVVQAMLEKLGLCVSVANNGQEAIAVIKQRAVPFDVVLMDCEMPVMDGYDASRLIRSLPHEWAGHMPIIALSANSSESSSALALQSGMSAYIAKPVRQKALQEALRNWVK